VPADLEAEAAQLTSRATAAAALITVGLDSADVLPACGLPDMRYRQPAPQAAATFEEQVAALLANAKGGR
jgi:hypothetical protein